MIRVIARCLMGDTGVGALIGDFNPEQIAPLLRLMETVPMFDTTDSTTIRIADGVLGGPLQWVVGSERTVLEVLFEEVSDEDAENARGWVFDPESFIGIRPN